MSSKQTSADVVQDNANWKTTCMPCNACTTSIAPFRNLPYAVHGAPQRGVPDALLPAFRHDPPQRRSILSSSSDSPKSSTLVCRRDAFEAGPGQDLGVSPRPPSLTVSPTRPRGTPRASYGLFVAVLYAICCTHPSLLSTTATWIYSKKVSNLNVRMELKVAVSRMHRRWACPQIK